MALSRDSKLAVARRRMVEEQLVRFGIRDPRVLDVMTRVPRHRCVAPVLAPRAYGSHALPIGGGQTISHPRIVALMCEALQLQGHERVLEIGTGSGYQTAVLALLTREVWSTERLPELAERAARVLAEMGLANIHLRTSASLAWPEAAPFDIIVASAAAPEVPGVLLQQLEPGGRLVLPVGRESRQQLLLLTRRGGEVVSRSLGHCRFVPLLGPVTSSAGRPGQAGAEPV